MPYNPDARPSAVSYAASDSPSNAPSSATAAARAARESVAAMRRALLGSGEAGAAEIAGIEACMPALERAVVLLRGLSPPAGRDREPGRDRELGRDRERLRRELTALRMELAGASCLASAGSAFYRGLARLLGAASGGYTPSGEGAPLEPTGTLLLRG